MNKETHLIYQQIIVPWAGLMLIQVEPLFYQGAIAGSEFLIYDVDKLYLCANINGSTTGSYAGGGKYLEYYNEANILVKRLVNNNAFYDTSGLVALQIGNEMTDIDAYFSRIVGTNLVYMKFIGYRITRV